MEENKEGSRKQQFDDPMIQMTENNMPFPSQPSQTVFYSSKPEH